MRTEKRLDRRQSERRCGEGRAEKNKKLRGKGRCRSRRHTRRGSVLSSILRQSLAQKSNLTKVTSVPSVTG